MTISAILPVYNGEHFIAQAVTSVLAQTVAIDEVIVIDDGSTDGTRKELASFENIHVIGQANAGAGAARNHGIAASTGQYLAFLDADDLWVEDKIERQLAALHRDDGCELVFGHVEQFGPHATPGTRPMPGYIPSAMMLSRSSFQRVGDFATDPSLPEFAPWFLRAREAGLRVRMLDEVVAHRRLHAANKGRTTPDQGRGYLRALKASLDRRRRNSRGDV